MTKLKKIMKEIESAMMAVTFAEAGEFETAREIINKNRKVLLGINDADIKALKYSINICQRIDAGLDILFVSEPKRISYAAELLKRFKSELDKEDIYYRITQKSGHLKQEIVDYTMNRSEILFVVVGSSSEIDIDFNKCDNKLSSSWEKLKCPLVVVTDNRMPVAV